MKALVYKQYGTPDVLTIKEVEKPIPKDNEVLIKVYAASLNSLDYRMLSADPFLVRFINGLFKPRMQILGADVAGRVEAVGKKVTRFKPGDEVFGDTFSSGLGGFAGYACAAENDLVLKPADATFNDVASLPIAAITALQALRDAGKIEAGKKVLINGASGGVGTFAVQIAKSFGAEVTAVCSTGKMDMVRSLGADHVIDYKKEDFTKNGQTYDLIVAVNGYHSIFDYKRSLKRGGKYVMIGGTGKQLFQAILLGPWISMTGDKKMGTITAKTTREDLEVLKELLETGKIKPVIDRCYPFSEIIDAFWYFSAGHVKGKVIISME